uniref:Secreted protein n=1 Tax=Trypanosoma congolense (strain IL3000) TaxID=1068625 RepID=G0UKP6_TRYCI|nr:hypothetical protein, unlikely [Trypanosoma congolense IL3000]
MIRVRSAIFIATALVGSLISTFHPGERHPNSLTKGKTLTDMSTASNKNTRESYWKQRQIKLSSTYLAQQLRCEAHKYAGRILLTHRYGDHSNIFPLLTLISVGAKQNKNKERR